MLHAADGRQMRNESQYRLAWGTTHHRTAKDSSHEFSDVHLIKLTVKFKSG